MKREIWVNHILFQILFLAKRIYKNRANEKIFKRLLEIESKDHKIIFGRKIFNYKFKGKNTSEVKLNIKEIAQENLFMYKRLFKKSIL